jgi:hypothetical protein
MRQRRDYASPASTVYSARLEQPLPRPCDNPTGYVKAKEAMV